MALMDCLHAQCQGKGSLALHRGEGGGGGRGAIEYPLNHRSHQISKAGEGGRGDSFSPPAKKGGEGRDGEPEKLATHLKLPMCSLQELLRLIRRTARSQHELVNHDLMPKFLHIHRHGERSETTTRKGGGEPNAPKVVVAAAGMCVVFLGGGRKKIDKGFFSPSSLLARNARRFLYSEALS